MEQILAMYYAENAKKLRKTVDKILAEYGGIADKDYDDFYSIANDVFTDIVLKDSYNASKGTFEGYLYSCLENKIKAEITRRNRYKRLADRMCISIDTPIGEDEDFTLADVIVSDVDIEKEVLDRHISVVNGKVEQYLKSLNCIQRKIIEMKMQNIEVQYIKQKLGLSDKQYASYMKQAIQYEYIRVLDI